MIITCPTCNQKNKIPDRPRTDGIYHCGVNRCKTLLLNHKVEFHSGLIRKVIDDLRNVKEDLESIRFSVFHQRDIYRLREKYEKIESRIQNWYDHVAFIRDPIERQQIYGSYKQELRYIHREINVVGDLIYKKEEIKRIVRQFKSLAQVFRVLNGALKLASGVLSIIGVDVDNLQFMLEGIDIYLIGSKN